MGSSIVFTVIVSCALLALLLAAAIVLLTAPANARSTKRGRTMPVTCPVCGHAFEVSPESMRSMTNVEIGLAVSSMPDLAGKSLVECVCPRCESALCFEEQHNQLRFAGSNIYTAHDRPGLCQNCQRPLATPPWPVGAYEGKLKEGLDISPDIGLVCARCEARCCYSCVQNATRNRTKGGALICPRCFRTPVDKVFYPGNV
jgi:hypothetical protein